jgi:hypothetical protein
MKTKLNHWYSALQNRPGGDILAVQTLRNSLMGASVLASAALVGLMGVLATAHLHPRWTVSGAAMLLVVSAACSLRSVWLLSAAGFDLRADNNAVHIADSQDKPANDVLNDKLITELTFALKGIRYSGMFLIVAMSTAAMSVLF